MPMVPLRGRRAIPQSIWRTVPQSLDPSSASFELLRDALRACPRPRVSVLSGKGSRPQSPEEKVEKTEKKEDAIQLLTQENEIKDFRLFRNELITISLLVVLIGLAGVGYLWKYRIKLKQVAELEQTRAAL